jgi:hypothetical protein
MESNSLKGRIQVSEQTAELLFKANKGHILRKREDKVLAKGKGALQTYWLDVNAASGSVFGSSLDPEEDSPDNIQDDEPLDDTGILKDETTAKRLSSRHSRLVDWNTECLLHLLKQIAVRREANRSFQAASQPEVVADARTTSGTVLDEVKDCIDIPEFHAELERMQQDAGSVELSEKVSQQLRDYISTICCMYRRNHFHNFDHASHVAM